MWMYMLYILVAVILAGLVITVVHLWRVAQKNKAEMAQYEVLPPEESTPNLKYGKALIVYYSLSGKTQDIASRIQSQTNADLFEIRTKQPLKKGASLYFDIKYQLKNTYYPEFIGEMPDFNAYDLIIIGAPVWWYTVATPVLSFLKEADFAGKPVAVYSTEGSNPGTFFEDFKSAAKNANIISGISFNNLPKKYDTAVNNKITRWLNSFE